MGADSGRRFHKGGRPKTEDAPYIETLQTPNAARKNQKRHEKRRERKREQEDELARAAVKDNAELATAEDNAELATAEDNTELATAEDNAELATVEDDTELATAEDNATRCLNDLPTDVLCIIFMHCDLATLEQLRCVSALCLTQSRSAARHPLWRRANAVDLGLSRLAAAAFTSVALHGVSGGIRGLAMSGDLLASGSKDHMCRLWGMRTLGTCFAEYVHPAWVGPVALTRRAGGLVATGADDGVVRIYSTDAAAAAPKPPIELRGASTAWLSGLGWVGGDAGTADDDPTTPMLLSCSRDGEAVLWDVDDRCRLHSDYSPPVSLPGNRSSALVTAFAMVGDVAAVARLGSGPHHEEPEAIHVLRVLPGARAGSSSGWHARTLSLDGIAGPVGSLAVDSSNVHPHKLASTHPEGQLRLWDLQQEACVGILENGGTGVGKCLALAGCMLVASRGSGPMLNVWDLRTQRIGTRLRGHTNNDALTLQLEGTRGRLACGGRMGKELRVWNFL